MSAEEIFEQRMRLSRLFAMYGALLTAKQYQCLSFYFDDDLSLSEIADELGVSRQAVHDLLKRVELTLEKYEEKLGMLSRYEEEQDKILAVINLLNGKTAREKQAKALLLELSGEGR